MILIKRKCPQPSIPLNPSLETTHCLSNRVIPFIFIVTGSPIWKDKMVACMPRASSLILSISHYHKSLLLLGSFFFTGWTILNLILLYMARSITKDEVIRCILWFGKWVWFSQWNTEESERTRPDNQYSKCQGFLGETAQQAYQKIHGAFHDTIFYIIINLRFFK